MGSTHVDEPSVADDSANQSRREALRRFGRYAAAAPTAMILLEPREGAAAGKGRALGRGKGRGWGKGGGGSDY